MFVIMAQAAEPRIRTLTLPTQSASRTEILGKFWSFESRKVTSELTFQSFALADLGLHKP